jgi:hypothetical protein
MQGLLEVLKNERFQTAIIGALLGAISTFALSYWGIHLDFGEVIPQKEEVVQVEQSVETSPEVSTESSEPVPVETVSSDSDTSSVSE